MKCDCKVECNLCRNIEIQVKGIRKGSGKTRLGFYCPVCGRYWARNRLDWLRNRIRRVFGLK